MAVRLEDLDAELLRRLWRALPYTVYVFDLRQQQTLYLNHHLGVALGYGDEAIRRMGPDVLRHLLHPDDLRRLPQLIARWDQIDDHDVVETEHRMRHADGEWRWMRGRDVVFERDAGGCVTKIIGTSIDITDRKRLERQLLHAHRLEAIGLIAGGVAHDFNNLLTAINGFAELGLQKIDRGAESRGELQQIVEATARAAEITGSLLGFANHRARHAETAPPNNAIQRTVKILDRLIGEQIALQLDLAPEADTIRVDRAALTQIILNLALNARDAMPEGGTLTIRTRRAGDGLLLEVVDTGIGMTSETQRRIFEPFFTTKDHGTGTGLGLSTVGGIVERLGGTISVESEPGYGARFHLRLPVAVTAPAPGRERPSHPGPRPIMAGRVLLVEDDESVRRMLRTTLEHLGADVHDFGNAADAIAWLEAQTDPPGLLITDVVLPGAAGQLVADTLRAHRPDAGVLFISGYAPDHPALQIDLPGALFLDKPFGVEEFLDRVATLGVS